MTKSPSSDLLLAGIVGAARGLRGEVSVDVRTDRAQSVFDEGATLVQFEDVTTREDAEALRGVELLVEPESEDDAWYAAELEGLKVEDIDGNALGVVSGLVAAPAHDLLIVRAGQVDVMVPFVEEIVPTISVAEGRVVVNAPSGLFPDADQVAPQD